MQFFFKKATKSTQSLILNWLAKPHIMQWWDERTEHPEGGLTRRDLKKFVEGQPSIFTHWITYDQGTPYAYIMTSDASGEPNSPYAPYIEKLNQTLTIDFFIGDENYLNRGMSYTTLKEFAKFLPNHVSALIVDPEEANKKAIHIYSKAGFRQVGAFVPTSGPFLGVKSLIMKLNLDRDPAHVD